MAEFDPDDAQDSDYDGAWKEALRLHLAAFLDCYFPNFAELVDWSIEPEWLDKEIGQIIGQANRRNRAVDVLFKVFLKTGQEQWILCHLEIQTSHEANFEWRVDLYNAGLKWTYQRDVITLVILADLRSGWRPCERRFELAGFKSHLQFPICKVTDRLESDWNKAVSLPVEVARAQVAALRTANDPDARFHAKTEIVRNLYKAGYTADTIRELYRLIDWMMHLRRDLESQFEHEMIVFEEELSMPYVTSIERNAEARGIERGRQGTIRLLLRLLSRSCGELPSSLQEQIQQLSTDQCLELGDALLDFKSAEDLRAWLSRHITPE